MAAILNFTHCGKTVPFTAWHMAEMDSAQKIHIETTTNEILLLKNGYRSLSRVIFQFFDLTIMPVTFMNGAMTRKRNRWRWFLVSLTSVNNATRPLTRNPLLLLPPPQGLLGPWLINHPWTPFFHIGPKTLINALWASHFEGTKESSLPTRPVLHLQTEESLSIRTRSLLTSNLDTTVTTSPPGRTLTAETRISLPSKVDLPSFQQGRSSFKKGRGGGNSNRRK